jgi:predicted ATPase
LPLYVIDEPEAHLHPRAVQSVRQWLQELSRPINANGVLVATHDESFFALSAAEAKFLLLGRQAGKTRIRRLDGDLWVQLGVLSEELGCSRASLLQYTRLAVIVEGEHDPAHPGPRRH